MRYVRKSTPLYIGKKRQGIPWKARSDGTRNQ